jgi:cytochrome c biogenesis protein CcmG/thiol:disulfide interchange protein DsbE
VLLGKKLSYGALIAWIAVLGLLALLAFGLQRAQRGPVVVGKTAPEFNLTSFDGQTFTSNSLQGKVVVLNFWASWCKPCEQEAGFLEEAWQSYKDRGDVVFFGIDYADTEPEALKFIQKFGVTYPNGPDLGTRHAQLYRITGVPETYIIGRDGKLAFRKFSPFLSTVEIQNAIDPLLGQ